MFDYVTQCDIDWAQPGTWGSWPARPIRLPSRSCRILLGGRVRIRHPQLEPSDNMTLLTSHCKPSQSLSV